MGLIARVQNFLNGMAQCSNCVQTFYFKLTLFFGIYGAIMTMHVL